MKIAILGAGAWGTALACSAALRHEVMLWARDPRQAQGLARDRENARYLPGVRLPDGLGVTDSHAEAAAHGAQGLVVVATPMSALRESLQRVAPQTPLLWLCKGLEAGTGALGHEIALHLRPGSSCGVLSGPSFALEVAQGRPTAVVVASTDGALCERAVQAFHSEGLRVYTCADPAGVEVGGAVKNVMAIAAGLLDGLAQRADLPQAPGLNARAALITRGLAEIARFGVARGARVETFMGLAGLGDLVLTCTGDLSRNRRVGLGLAAGQPLAAVLEGLGHVAEGVPCTEALVRQAAERDVEVPIAAAVSAVLDGRLQPREAVLALLAREPRRESDR